MYSNIYNLKNQQVIRLLRIAHQFSFKKIVNRIAHTNSGGAHENHNVVSVSHQPTKTTTKTRKESEVTTTTISAWNSFLLHLIRLLGCVQKRIYYYFILFFMFVSLCGSCSTILVTSGPPMNFLIVSAKTLWCVCEAKNKKMMFP